jgi:hypothetical protein
VSKASRVYLCGTESPPAGPFRGAPGSQHGSEVLACPRESEHQYGPAGYVEWHEWADKSRKDWKQVRCECGRYLLIESKSEPRSSEQDGTGAAVKVTWANHVHQLGAVCGERVRYTERGTGSTMKYEIPTGPDLGPPIEASYSVVIEGEVTGWEYNSSTGAWLMLAGYGRVRAELCEVIE